jgi:hypothetical protein
MVDEAPLGGRGGGDGVAGEGHLQCPLAAHVARHRHERRVAEQPALAAGMAKPAVSAAMARSHVATSWQPAAVASACTRAMTTCGTDCTVSIISVHTSNRWRMSASAAPAMSPKLCPAENTGPVAARITPVASVPAMSRNACVSSIITSSARALRFSGRLRVMVVMGPSLSTSRCW